MAALCLLGAIAPAGCSDDAPALTLAFQGVPAGTTDIHVTLHAMNVSFAAADASSGDVAVTYVGGDIQIAIDGAFAARHANRIRLPLTAGADIPRLEGTARASGGVAEKTAEAWVAVTAHRSATLTFDFDAADAGVETSPAVDARSDASADADAAQAADAGGDATGGADAAADAPVDRSPEVPVDRAADVSPPDAPVEMPAGDAPADAPPADAPADATLAPDASPDASPDAPIPTACTAVPPRAASSTPGGGGPALAATPAGLFGLVWRASSGNILYNSFTDAEGMRAASDVAVLTAGTRTLGDPRLARVGDHFVIAYGLRADDGVTFTAATKIDPHAGQLVNGATSAAGPTDTMPPVVGGIVVTPDQSRLGIVSRRAGASARTQAEVVRMAADLTGGGSVRPTALATTWTTAIAWASSAARPNRFVVASISDASAAGGTLLDVAEQNLQLGASAAFTGAGDTPLAGGGGATLSAAGIGDATAVVWIDDHTGEQEVWIALVDLTSGSRRGAVRVSAGGTLPKQYPKVVFDGAALAVAWLEVQTGADSRVWLRRFDLGLAPVGTPLAIGPVGAATFGDIGLAAPGPGKYGIAFSRSGSPGTKSFSYVDCR